MHAHSLCLLRNLQHNHNLLLQGLLTTFLLLLIYAIWMVPPLDLYRIRAISANFPNLSAPNPSSSSLYILLFWYLDENICPPLSPPHRPGSGFTLPLEFDRWSKKFPKCWECKNLQFQDSWNIVGIAKRNSCVAAELLICCKRNPFVNSSQWFDFTQQP